MPNTEKQRAYQRAWYARNKAKQKQWVRDRYQSINEWWNQYKSTLSCEQCGESHPGCLDFHHLDPEVKEGNLSEAVANGWGKDRILAEVDKCMVLCANCHRKLHWTEKHNVQ